MRQTTRMVLLTKRIYTFPMTFSMIDAITASNMYRHGKRNFSNCGFLLPISTLLQHNTPPYIRSGTHRQANAAYMKLSTHEWSINWPSQIN